MYQINEIKKMIELKDIPITTFIFKYTDSTFIPHQYTKAISDILNLPILYISKLSEVTNSRSLFSINNDYLYVYYTDKLEQDVSSIKNLIVITKSVAGDIEYVDVPKIEDWHKKDYAFSICDGADEKDLTILYDMCSDIYQIDNEFSKISIFSKSQRKYKLKGFIEDSVFSYLSKNNIFDFTSSLMSKDLSKIMYLLDHKYECDIEPLAVVSILYKNVKNMLIVGTSKNPTEQSTGLKQNQIYAIKKSLSKFNLQQLLSIFDLVTSVDYLLKKGELPADMILDYVTCNVLKILK